MVPINWLHALVLSSNNFFLFSHFKTLKMVVFLNLRWIFRFQLFLCVWLCALADISIALCKAFRTAGPVCWKQLPSARQQRHVFSPNVKALPQQPEWQMLLSRLRTVRLQSRQLTSSSPIFFVVVAAAFFFPAPEGHSKILTLTPKQSNVVTSVAVRPDPSSWRGIRASSQPA